MIFRRLFLKLWRRRRFEHDLEAELAFHREQVREHANPIGLGNVVRIQEEARDLWRLALVEDFWRDVVYAVRGLRRAPGFAVIAILTLALGIGANTAIFTLMDRVMLKSLPVQEPSGLIELLGNRGGDPINSFSYQALQYFRAHAQTCSNIIAASNIAAPSFHALIEGRSPERLAGQYVTGDYFGALGVKPLIGRHSHPKMTDPLRPTRLR